MPKLARFAAVFLLLLDHLLADDLRSPDLGAVYDQAMLEFRAGNYGQAIKELDRIEAIPAAPNEKAEALNLRGVILIRQREYEAAELVLRHALEIEPALWNASFNLAEIPFLKKDWSEARRRFEEILARENGAIAAENQQLIRYKILLSDVLEGNAEATARVTKQLEAMSDTSPAVYYLRAALARQHYRSGEAAKWIAAAEARFPVPLRKLYEESFYEIGWEQKAIGAPRQDFEIVAADRTTKPSADIQADLALAEKAFLEHNTDLALALLDRVDHSSPSLAASHNLRAEILMEQKKFDAAELELCQALDSNPRFHEAAYNLAEIAFKQRRFREARQQFERLFADTSGPENEAAQLIKFKIFLTLLLEGQESPAQQMMNQFRFTGQTPALYYAEAAWAFKHAEPKSANAWIASARRIYSLPLNIIFADPFYDLGWLQGWPQEEALSLSASDASRPAPSPGDFPIEVFFGLANRKLPVLETSDRPGSH